MLAPPSKQSAAARRQLRYRRRRKNKARCYRLDLSDHAVEGLIDQLVATGKLTDREARNHRRLEIVIAQLLEAQGLNWAR